MIIDQNSLAVRLVIASCLFYLIKQLIDLLITTPALNRSFTIALLVFCLLIVFISGLFIK